LIKSIEGVQTDDNRDFRLGRFYSENVKSALVFFESKTMILRSDELIMVATSKNKSYNKR